MPVQTTWTSENTQVHKWLLVLKLTPKYLRFSTERIIGIHNPGSCQFQEVVVTPQTNVRHLLMYFLKGYSLNHILTSPVAASVNLSENKYPPKSVYVVVNLRTLFTAK